MAQSDRSLRHGIVVGLIAYAAVALFYSAFDFLAARSVLHTVNLLGLAVFSGLRDPAILQYPTELDATAILSYNAVHLLTSLAIGVFVTKIVARAEQRPAQSRLIFLIVVVGFFATIVVVGQLTISIRPLVPWWSIVVANVIAVIFAGMYLAGVRPGLWSRISPFRRLEVEGG